MRNETRRVVRLYCSFQFFFSLLLWLPVFYEYQRRIGLGDSEIFAIQSIYYTVFCLLEIPTGIAADRWGYRRCLVWGGALLVAANLLPIFAQSYTGFLAHFLLIAVSRSLISGASSAYLYDFLANASSAIEYKQVEGRARAYGLVGKVVCWAAVGALMQWRLTLPYWLTTVSAAISVGFALALPEIVGSRGSGGSLEPIGLGLGARIRSTATAVWRSPFLAFLMLQGVAIFVLGRICQVNLFQPILGSKSFDLASYGVVMSLMTLFEALGSACPNWLRRVVDDLNAVFLLTLVMAGTLALVPISGQVATTAWLCLFSLAAGFAFPIQRQLLNDSIPDSRYRATLLSLESIVDRAVCAWVASLLGAIIGGGKLDAFLRLSAAVAIGSVFVLALALRLLNYGRSGEHIGAPDRSAEGT